jgi:hypothetical protein
VSKTGKHWLFRFRRFATFSNPFLSSAMSLHTLCSAMLLHTLCSAMSLHTLCSAMSLHTLCRTLPRGPLVELGKGYILISLGAFGPGCSQGPLFFQDSLEVDIKSSSTHDGQIGFAIAK